jgi:hypothetical protein
MSFNGRNVALLHTSFYQIHVTLPHGRGSVTPSASQSISDLFNNAPPGEGTPNQASQMNRYNISRLCSFYYSTSYGLHVKNIFI